MPTTHVCPRCQRVNPGPALFCYHDGAPLQVTAAAAAAVATGQLPQEYVFPSRRRVRTLEDFVQGCHYEWEDARDALRHGEFARYFTAVGRADLARAAQETAAHADADIGLHNFLTSLPVEVKGPSLDLNPRRVVLGKLRPGESKQVRLVVLNRGRGLLQGKINVAEGGQWLRLDGGGPAGADGQCPLKTDREQAITLQIDTRGLPAPQSYTGRLTVITNGGIAEVPVRLDLGTVPFGLAPFAGAGNPREIADAMRKNPRAAVPLLESGEVQRWFAANGWAYPVRGVPARGVAAVQQFFEAMGLSKPPAVQVSEPEVNCLCVAPEVARRQVVVFAAVKKWVYAQVDSDAHWLRVLTPNVSGAQQAAVAFEIDSSLMDEGRVHEGRLQIAANGGQLLTVRVRVDVRRPHRPFTRRLFGPFLKVALVALLYRALLVVPSELYARESGEAFGRDVLTAAEPDRTPPSLVRQMNDLKASAAAADHAWRPDQAAWLAPDDENVAWVAGRRWTWPATEEDGYLARFVVATFLVGAAATAWQVWKRRSQWSDYPSGAIAGLMAGVVLAATAGCLLALGDLVPRLVLAAGGGGSLGLFVLLAVVWWAALGAALGFLLPLLFARAGHGAVETVLWPAAAVCRLCGLGGAAGFFSVRGV